MGTCAPNTTTNEVLITPIVTHAPRHTTTNEVLIPHAPSMAMDLLLLFVSSIRPFCSIRDLGLPHTASFNDLF